MESLLALEVLSRKVIAESKSDTYAKMGNTDGLSYADLKKINTKTKGEC